MKVLGHSMSWGEAQRLTVVLLMDPGSQVAAAVRGWSHPIAREDMVLRDIFDLQHMSKAKRKPDPYARPWHRQPKRIGGASMTGAEFQAIKRRAAEQN